MIQYDIVAQGLLRLTNWFSKNIIWDCGSVGTMEATFEESYAIRALLHTQRVLGLGHIENVAHTFCDVNVALQGVHYENMYDMGYGYDRDEKGMVNCSCVADCSSVARAIIDTVAAYPDYPKNDVYIKSLKRFIDYVLDHFVTEKGVIGVGILGHEVNPMPEYWCANGLFSQVLISFAALTGDSRYYDAAVAPLEFLATFDYRNTEWNEWNTQSPQEMILYTGEGIVEGLTCAEMQKRLHVTPRGVIGNTTQILPENSTKCTQAANRVQNAADPVQNDSGSAEETIYDLLRLRWNEFADWLYKNQGSDGLWYSPHHQEVRDYETGLSWLIFRAGEDLDKEAKLHRAAERQLNYLVCPEAKGYFGLFCRPFATALAHLSFAYVAEKLMEKDPEGFERALSQEMKSPLNAFW